MPATTATAIHYSRYLKMTASSTATSVSEQESKENVQLDAFSDAEEVEGLLQIGSPPKRHIDEMQGDVLETPPRHKKAAKIAPVDEDGDEDEDADEDADSGAWEPFELGKRR